MILAIDSSAGTSVAVVDADGAVIAERASVDPRAHAESVGVLLAEVLTDPGAITAVAYGAGPGPFTGLRVGIAAARTAAQALGVPALAVVSPDAVAIAAARTGRFVVTADAKRRERYFTVYTGLDEHGLPVRESEPQVGPPDAVPPLDAVEAAPTAAAIGRIAALRIRLGRAADDPVPLYLRAPDVTPAAPKRVSA